MDVYGRPDHGWSTSAIKGEEIPKRASIGCEGVSRDVEHALETSSKWPASEDGGDLSRRIHVYMVNGPSDTSPCAHIIQVCIERLQALVKW